MENDDLVSLLWQARRSGQPGLDLSSHAIDRATALDLQLAVLQRFLDGGDKLGGWKVEFTAGAARNRLGSGYRPFGYVLGSHLLPSGCHIPWESVATGALVGIDAELCLVLARDVVGPVSVSEARGSVSAVVAALEVTQRRRSPTCDDGTLIADGFSNWGIVASPVRLEGILDLTTTRAAIFHDGNEVSRRAEGHVIDDPFASLAALATTLAEHGQRLTAGQYVITGALTSAQVGPGTWTAFLGHDSSVSVTFD